MWAEPGRVAMTKRILVVESGIPVIPFEQSLLLRRDHEMHRASTGAEALEKVGSTEPCLVITDERLSDMGGAEFLKKMRDLPQGRHAAAILLTSTGGEAPPGVNLVLRKPLSGTEFSEACQKLLSIAVRKDARLLVYVQVQGYVQSSLFLCNSLNLSASGILILTARRLKLGEKIQLQITLPLEKDKVRVTGEVVREAKEVESRLNAYGVLFTDLTAEDRERLGRFVDRELSRRGPEAGA